MDVDAFARALLAGQPTFPRYFARMRPINQAGPRLLGGVVPAIGPLSGDDLTAALDGGAWVVDTRAPEAHERERIPGSLSIPAGSSFGTWLGWVVESDQPVVLLVDAVADLDDLARQALRIGFESIVGYVDGGLGRVATIRAIGRGRRHARRRSPGLSRIGRRPGRARSSSTSARRRSSRPATSRARSTSGRAT